MSRYNNRDVVYMQPTPHNLCLEIFFPKPLKVFPHQNSCSMQDRAFHTCSNLLGDLVILPLYPTDQKSKIAAKYTASDGGSKSAQLAHVPDRKQASQADSEPPYEEVY